MKTVMVKIKGISPLLMNAFPMVPIEGFEKKTPQEQAESSAYRIDGPGSNLYVPGTNLQRSLVDAATYSKGKGRASLQKQAAAAIFITPDQLDLGVSEYVIDSRPVVIKSTGGRIVRHRPKLIEWEVEFMIEWDDVLISEVQLRKIVDDAGSRVGLLDFRPAKKGPFGRFSVIHWETE